jgi:hypothetical protein
MYTGSLEEASNRATLTMQSPLIDDDGTSLDLTNIDMYFWICEQGCPSSPKLSASLVGGSSDGITLLPGNLEFQIKFTKEQMGVLCAGTYDAFFRVIVEGDEIQVLATSIPIVEGGPNG